MKFSEGGRQDSFYESFSDLIFATMAIFVLLMTIFLTLVQPKGNIDPEHVKKLEQELVKKAEELDHATAERDRSREQINKLTEDLYNSQAAVTAKGLALVIGVDTTGSMVEPIGHLVEALRTITIVLPRITQEFYIGIVAYRDTNDGTPLQLFELRQIVIPAKDSGNSLASIESFLDSLNASNGLAPVGLAVEKAIDMFDSLPSSFAGYQSFMLLGDAGPYELTFEDMAYSPTKRRNEKPIIDRIATWAGNDKQRTVISLFSGNPNSPGLPEINRIQLQESMRFFKSVASASGQAENFTRNPARILEYLLTAIVESQ